MRIAYPHVNLANPASPVIADSRVPVRRLWAWHRGGTSIDTIIRRFPQLGAAKILAALAFAYDHQELIEQDLAREKAVATATGTGST